jgi:hypothetical protein
MTDCPSRFLLVRLAANDLPEAQRESIAAHLENCAQCRVQRDEIEGSTATYAAGFDIKEAALKRNLRNTPIPTRAWHWYAGAAAALILAIGALAYLTYQPPTPTSGDNTAVRYKGAMAVSTVVKRGRAQFVYTAGTPLHNNDALRFTVTVPHSGHLLVFYQEQGGTGSRVYPAPEEHTNSLYLKGSGSHLLPGSIVLDNSIGREQFYFAFSSAPFRSPPDVSNLKNWLQAQPPSVTVYRLDIQKE